MKQLHLTLHTFLLAFLALIVLPATARADFTFTTHPVEYIVLAECQDGIDNDADTFIDIDDPECHSDGDASNPASYVPTDDREADEDLPDLIAGSVSPTSAMALNLATLSAEVSNIGDEDSDVGLPAGSGFNSIFQFDDDSDHASIIAVKTVSTPMVAASDMEEVSTTYTFSTAGTWYVRACADNNSSFSGIVDESNENNNCGPWTEVEVTEGGSGGVSVNLTASTNGPVAPGTNVSLRVFAYDFGTSVSCSINQGIGSVGMSDDGGGNWSTTASEIVNPAVTTTYTATCTSPEGTENDSETILVGTGGESEICGNGIDDDDDGLVDEGCGGLPQCSDGADNDGDTLVDSDDPGCHTDGDSLNPATYDANDDDESNRRKPIFIEF